MKKYLTILIAVTMIITFVSCDNSSDPTPTPTPTPPVSSEESAPDPTPTEEPSTAKWEPAPVEVTEADKIDKYVDVVVGDTEQGPVWYYLSDDGDGVRELYYTPNWGDNWQYSENPSVDDVYFSLFDQDEVYRAWAGTWAGFNIKIIIAWRAYQDGTVQVGEWDYTAFEYNSAEMNNIVDGGVVTVKHNDTQLYTGTTTTNPETNLFEGIEVDVSEGDIIYFIMDGENANKATFTIDGVSVSYKE